MNYVKKTNALHLTSTTYVHDQIAPSNTWTVNHNLNKFPNVTIVDSGGNVVIGDIQYLSDDSLMITFTSAFSGRAFLN